jgi:hypothetical protein
MTATVDSIVDVLKGQGAWGALHLIAHISAVYYNAAVPLCSQCVHLRHICLDAILSPAFGKREPNFYWLHLIGVRNCEAYDPLVDWILETRWDGPTPSDMVMKRVCEQLDAWQKTFLQASCTCISRKSPLASKPQQAQPRP